MSNKQIEENAIKLGDYDDLKNVPTWPKIYLETTKGPLFSNLIATVNGDEGHSQDYFDKSIHRWSSKFIVKPTFQRPVNVDICNFRLYITESDYFISNLLPITATWSSEIKSKKEQSTGIRYNIKNHLNYKEEQYYAMICGVYVASFLCGIALNHLNFSKSRIIQSLVKYHLYYQIRKFMKHPSLLDKYDFTELKKHIPYKGILKFDKNNDGYYVNFQYSTTDYRSFIAYHSEGITSVGKVLLQESIESFVYTILGSQANTRWSIVNHGAKSLQTQNVFRKLLNDTILQNDTTVLISNMRKAIKDTNVVLNMAISPGMILIPSRLIILNKKIDGYNNILTLANKTMKFGINSKINYYGIKKEEPKKVHQDNTPSQHLDTLDEVNKKPLVHKHIKLMVNNPHQTDMIALLGISTLSTFILVKYVL